MVPIIIANELNKKIIFAGNTYGPFDESEKLYFSFFNSLKNVEYYSRDDVYSISWLKQLGIDKEVKLIPDDLYFVNNQLVNNDYTNYSNYIILELYASMSEIETNIEEIRRFVKNIRDFVC